MSELTDKEMHDLRALQTMADKGFAAWTNENFMDVLDTFDEVQRIRGAQSEHISKLGKQIAGQKEELAAARDWIKRMSGAPDTQVSGFVRTACVAFLTTGVCSEKLPPGDPLKRAERAEASEADQGAWITTLEEKLRTLGRRNAAMLRRLDVMRRRAEKAEAELAKLRESKDICPVCLTWSWAPCDEGDEGAEQRGEEWALCQCCNDSRIAMLWKEKYDAAFTGLLGASRGECVAWGRRDRQPEIDKLREALRNYGSHSLNCAFLTTDCCDCDFEAALGKGDGKC